MLKHIPDILSPELLKVLQEMGHGDTICIGDGNFPGVHIGKQSGAVMVDLSGHGVCEILDAILKFFPLDAYVEKPVSLMAAPASEPAPIHEQYKKIIEKYCTRGGNTVQELERFAYYEKARECYAIIQTGETATYANIILQKGVVEHNKDGKLEG